MSQSASTRLQKTYHREWITEPNSKEAVPVLIEMLNAEDEGDDGESGRSQSARENWAGGEEGSAGLKGGAQ